MDNDQTGLVDLHSALYLREKKDCLGNTAAAADRTSSLSMWEIALGMDSSVLFPLFQTAYRPPSS
jgi:hypothetical protein